VGLNFCDVTEATNFAVKVKAMTPPVGSSKSHPTQKKGEGGFWSRLVGKVSGGSTVKTEIGGPTNVKRGAHIGYDPDKGFECSDIPEQWKQTFKGAGISKKDLQNPETAAVIYATLSQFNEPASPTPASPTPGGTSSSSPPHSQSDTPPMDAPPMDAPPMDAPPMDAPPMDSPDSPPHSPLKTPAGGPSAKAAPPPSGGGQSDLLASIRQGTKLRSAATSPKAETKETASAPLPDLSRMTSTETNTVMSALQKAMAERGKAIQVDDEEEGGDKDDWDD